MEFFPLDPPENLYEQPRCDRCCKFIPKEYFNSLMVGDGKDWKRIHLCKKCQENGLTIK